MTLTYDIRYQSHRVLNVALYSNTVINVTVYHFKWQDEIIDVVDMITFNFLNLDVDIIVQYYCCKRIFIQNQTTLLPS